MIRFVVGALGAVLLCSPAVAQVADVNCSIAKAFRCKAEGCEAVPLEAGIRFNLGSKQACLTKGGACSGSMAVDSSERLGDDVVVRFKGNGMVIRINAQSGNMVGGDASQNNLVFAYGGACK